MLGWTSRHVPTPSISRILLTAIQTYTALSKDMLCDARIRAKKTFIFSLSFVLSGFCFDDQGSCSWQVALWSFCILWRCWNCYATGITLGMLDEARDRTLSLSPEKQVVALWLTYLHYGYQGGRWRRKIWGGGGGQWYILYLWYLWEGSGTSFTHSVLFIRHHHDTYTGACWESCMWLPVFTPLALW